MIRPATGDDVPKIVDLVVELAVFEAEPDAVQLDADSLREALFGPTPQVFCHVAEIDGMLAGAAIWFVNFSTWTGRHGIYLEDLIITAGHRGRGVGRALFSELAAICTTRGYRRVDWSVLDWNTSAIGFYEGLGAQPQSGWLGYRLTGPALLRAAEGAQEA